MEYKGQSINTRTKSNSLYEKQVKSTSKSWSGYPDYTLSSRRTRIIQKIGPCLETGIKEVTVVDSW